MTFCLFSSVIFLIFPQSFGFSATALRVAYGMLNDTLASGVCIRFNAHHLALAALVVANRQLGEVQALPATVGLAAQR